MTVVHCPDCRTPVPLLPELAGKEVFCLGCGSHFPVPHLKPQASASDIWTDHQALVDFPGRAEILATSSVAELGGVAKQLP
jgi:hypothetical protein